MFLCLPLNDDDDDDDDDDDGDLFVRSFINSVGDQRRESETKTFITALSFIGDESLSHDDSRQVY